MYHGKKAGNQVRAETMSRCQWKPNHVAKSSPELVFRMLQKPFLGLHMKAMGFC